MTSPNLSWKWINMTRRYLMIATTSVALCGTVGTANATVFGGSATFTDITTGNALSVNASPNPRVFATSNIVAGQSSYFAGFMTLTTTDTGATGAPCAFFGLCNTDQVALTITWTNPSGAPNTTQNGSVSETTFVLAPAFDHGNLAWANDTHTDLNGRYAEQLVTFNDGAQAYVDIYDTALDGTTSSLAAQFDVRIRDKADPIPEPISMAVLGTGLLGLGMVRRKRA